MELKVDQNINTKEPFGKRRIEKNVNSLKDLSRTDDQFKGIQKNGSAKVKKKLRTKYKIGAKSFTTVMEKLKQHISAKDSEIEMFYCKSKAIIKKLDI